MTSLADIRLVVLDVDGVLTTGRLLYGEHGETLKEFDVKDGYGIAALRSLGVEFAVISGRDAAPLAARLSDLGIARAYLGQADKSAALTRAFADTSIGPDHTLAVGDDAPDLAMFERVALSACPADAHPSVRAVATWVTTRSGGLGAVREICDAIGAAKASARAKFRIVIPARFGSTRLPGKPLREIAGRPMIAHVWDRAVASGASEIVVATDDERIRSSVRSFGGEVAMTAADHQSGSDRIAEVVRARGWDGDSIVVNLQGDEPAMPADCISRVATSLASRPWSDISTLATPIADSTSLFNSNVVKVVLDARGSALFFSRAPIPWDRERFSNGEPVSLDGAGGYLRHLGIYAYRAARLLELADADPAPMEKVERLEQLRALHLGLDIHVEIVKQAPPEGVDTENDLKRIEASITS